MFWLTPEQEPLARAIAQGAGLRVAAAGGPQRGRVSPPTTILGVDTRDDLRRLLADHPDAVVVLLALGGDDRAAITDPDTQAAARAGSPPAILVTDPIFDTVSAFARAAEAHPMWINRLRPAPAFALSTGGESALGAVETFGRVRSVDFAARSGAGQLGLPFLLLDAMEFVAATLGEPEFVDASLSGVEAPSGLRLAPGDTVLSIAGDFTAHLRFSDDRAAAVSLSDRAGSWFRGATLLGVGGCLRCDDRALEWLSPTGETVETGQEPASASTVDRLLIEQVAAEVALPRAAAPPVVRRLTAWAIAEAAVLSARTGQPEAPATIRRMAGVA